MARYVKLQHRGQNHALQMCEVMVTGHLYQGKWHLSSMRAYESTLNINGTLCGEPLGHQRTGPVMYNLRYFFVSSWTEQSICQADHTIDTWVMNLILDWRVFHGVLVAHRKQWRYLAEMLFFDSNFVSLSLVCYWQRLALVHVTTLHRIGNNPLSGPTIKKVYWRMYGWPGINELMKMILLSATL